MWKAGGDPVDDHTYPRQVDGVDEALEVVRRAEPTRRGEETERLVAPRTVERVFGGRQELDVGVAHPGDVGNELLGKLPVGVVGVVGVPALRVKVHHVDRDRGVERVIATSFFHSRGVAPLV
jgi:hypothetical protein